MSKQRSWTDAQLTEAVKHCRSIRQVLFEIGLIPAGGNYVQVSQRIKSLGLETAHFTGMGWNKGLRYSIKSTPAVETLLVKNGSAQSYKLKNKLFAKGLKMPKCELCGWCEKSVDGRIPVELDHINGDRYDNRLENLRILCPNCHSLQSTHRGLNRGKNKEHLFSI